MPAAAVTQYPVYTGEFLFQVADTELATGQYGEQYKIKCEFVDVPKQHEFAGKTVSIWASTIWSLQDPAKAKDTRSKIVKITEAAFNRKLEVGEWCEAKYLQGRRLIIALYEKEECKQGVGAFKPYSKQPPMPAGKITDVAPDGSDDFDVGPAEASDWDDLPSAPVEEPKPGPITGEQIVSLRMLSDKYYCKNPDAEGETRTKPLTDFSAILWRVTDGKTQHPKDLNTVEANAVIAAVTEANDPFENE
jgi:hypothetical protein